MSKSKLLKDLNKEQVEAVTHKNGPMLIIAGAGTGKTTVITNRIAWLIEQKLARPEEILALTFTEKAAREMDERIMALLPMGMLDFTASTFHSFCQNILKDFGINIGISPDFKLLTEAQQILFFKQNIDEFKLDIYKPISNPDKFIAALIKLFSRAKDEIASVSDYLLLAKKYALQAKKEPNNLELAEQAREINEQAQAYKKYEELKDQNNYFDFGDLIIKTYQLLKERPLVLSQIQARYKYIFVDEFQDTNYSQAQIAYLIAKKYSNMTVVGDDDQSIYKFRGAAISNIMDFMKHYPKAKKVTLIKNYRSTQKILDSSYKLINNNNPDRLEIKEKVNKRLLGTKVGTQPIFWHFSDGYSEVEQIVKKIMAGVEKENKKYGDFGLLVRANNHADDFITLLKDNGVPYHFVGSRGLYDREEIRELRSYLKVLFNPDDNLALFHVAWADQYKIDKILLRRLTNIARQSNISLFEIFEHIDKFIKDEKTARESIKKIINLIKNHLELSKSYSTSKILVDYIHKSGMYNLFREIESYRQQEIFENIKLFFSKISEFEKISQDKSVFSFIEYLDLIIEAGDNPAVYEADKYEDAVNIMTVHAAKGLEFDTVFLSNLVDGRFPSRTRRDQIELPDELIKESIPANDMHIQEERRLFYVAMTRAKNELYLTSADKYANNKEEKKISRFISEALDTKPAQKFEKKQADIILPEEKTRKIVNQANGDVTLTPSNLETYNDCPKKFEYGYIFRLSGEASRSMSFGDSIHNTLRDYYRLWLTSKKPSSNELKAIFKNNWKTEGYSSKIEIESAYKKGLETVKNFIVSDKTKPIEIEKNFELSIGKCKLIGRIDRVNKVSDEIEIIDYKTGDGRKKNVSEVSKNIPLWIYAIYFSQKNNPENISITLNYILNNKIISAKINQAKLDKKNELIKNICDKISGSLETHDFPAQPSEQTCKYCQFKSVCPYKYKGA